LRFTSIAMLIVSASSPEVAGHIDPISFVTANECAHGHSGAPIAIALASGSRHL
jgi:hypothetical protein